MSEKLAEERNATLIKGNKRELECAQCGCECDNGNSGIIGEIGKDGFPVRQIWVEDIWMKLGYKGQRICAGCYLK